MERCEKVLIIASGRSALMFSEYDYRANGWTVVAANHAWQATNDKWDILVHTQTMRDLPNVDKNDSRPHFWDKHFIRSCAKFGGITKCGITIVIATSYWVLDNLEPKIIAYLGADMNYTPDKNGHTAFYGKGSDITQHGISDPDKMVFSYGNGDPNYLNNLFLRFETEAAKYNCKIYNFSNDEKTRLPYEKTTPKGIDNGI